MTITDFYLVFFGLGLALYCLIKEWVVNEQRDARCGDCPTCRAHR